MLCIPKILFIFVADKIKPYIYDRRKADFK